MHKFVTKFSTDYYVPIFDQFDIIKYAKCTPTVHFSECSDKFRVEDHR